LAHAQYAADRAGDTRIFGHADSQADQVAD